MLEGYFGVIPLTYALPGYALAGALIIALTERWNALGQITFYFALFTASLFVFYAGYVTHASARSVCLFQ